MKPSLLPGALASVILVAAVWADAPPPAASAEQIASDVVKASGGANWPKVRTLGFTFNVEQDGKTLLSAKHQWDMAKNTDTVSWGGKTVTVNIAAPASDEDSKAAFQRWTNDSYWLLAPLKFRDPGTKVRAVTPPPEDAGEFDVIELSFDKVGLTPGDTYHLYIDRAAHLLRRWIYMPGGGTKMAGTWDGYKEFGGLTLSTEHQFGDKRITFTDIAVTPK
jgi:hypothetical protein